MKNKTILFIFMYLLIVNTNKYNDSDTQVDMIITCDQEWNNECFDLTKGFQDNKNNIK